MNSTPQHLVQNDAAQIRGDFQFCTIAPAQLRAARSLLDWSRKALATASGLSPETIKNIEHGTFFPQDATVERLTRTFSNHGVEFVRHESIVRIPAGGEHTSYAATITYVGAVLASSSVQKIQEDSHD